MKYRYRREPGRLILALTDLDLSARRPVDPSRFLRLDLGRVEATVPPALDWDLQDAFEPVKVLYDPDGREWSPVQWTDTGRTAEMWTPLSG
mgnify:CR=1 FL=1